MSSSTEQAAAAALLKEREEKKQVVIDMLTAKCQEPSDFEDIQEFGKALKGGDALDLKILSGGVTNFTYKVSLKSDPTKRSWLSTTPFGTLTKMPRTISNELITSSAL